MHNREGPGSTFTYGSIFGRQRIETISSPRYGWLLLHFAAPQGLDHTQAQSVIQYSHMHFLTTVQNVQVSHDTANGNRICLHTWKKKKKIRDIHRACMTRSRWMSVNDWESLPEIFQGPWIEQTYQECEFLSGHYSFFSLWCYILFNCTAEACMAVDTPSLWQATDPPKPCSLICLSYSCSFDTTSPMDILQIWSLTAFCEQSKVKTLWRPRWK